MKTRLCLCKILSKLIDKLNMAFLLTTRIKNGVKINSVAVDVSWFKFNNSSDILDAEKIKTVFERVRTC